jgi:copper chaperone CopZ
MANLDRSFDIISKLTSEQGKNIKRTLESIEGINHVMVNEDGDKLTVGYTPGIINVQKIKEAIVRIMFFDWNPERSKLMIGTVVWNAAPAPGIVQRRRCQ